MKFPVILTINDQKVVSWADVEIPKEYEGLNFVAVGETWNCLNVEIGLDAADPIPGIDMTYLILGGDGRRYKIGHTTDLKDRMRKIRLGDPDNKCIAICPGGRPFEQELHKRFHTDRFGGEWFRLEPQQVISLRYEMWLRRQPVIKDEPIVEEKLISKAYEAVAETSNYIVDRLAEVVPITDPKPSGLSDHVSAFIEELDSFDVFDGNPEPLTFGSPLIERPKIISRTTKKLSVESVSVLNTETSSSINEKPKIRYDGDNEDIKYVENITAPIDAPYKWAWSNFLYGLSPEGTIIAVISRQIIGGDVSTLINILEQAPDTVRILIIKGKIGNGGSIAVADYLTKHDGIDTIDLSKNRIYNAGAEALAAFITKSKVIKYVNLRYNNISDVAGLALIAAFRSSDTIIEMDLRDNTGKWSMPKLVNENRDVIATKTPKIDSDIDDFGDYNF